MAGDWIKMRTDLYRDPKVCQMADIIMGEDSPLSQYVNQNCQRDMAVTRNVTRNVTVGALVSVWGVCRTRGSRVGDDLVIEKVTAGIVDDISEIPGFSIAMMEVGWLIEDEDRVVFPRFFEDWNVDPKGENKEKNAERQRRFRDKKKEGAAVTSNVTRNVTVTHREEGEREREESRNISSRKGDSQGKAFDSGSRSDSPASPDPPRASARMHWLAAVDPLFSKESKQRLSDKTSSERMFDELIWEEDADTPRAADRYRKALALVKRSSGRTNRMAWITKVINEELA
jgi:hypothetical protein